MKILISGASVAGLCAAYWFTRHGHDVTVVERASELRTGGSPIDVRGEALGVAERMGILDLVRARCVPPQPLPVYDRAGTIQASIDMEWFGSESDDDVEIVRDRLNSVIFDKIGSGANFYLSTEILDLDQDPSGVSVRLTGGTSDRFDLVVGADGLHSGVRRLAFGPEQSFCKHMGYYVGLVFLDPSVEWRRAFYNVPGTLVAIRDTGVEPLGFTIFCSEEIEYDYRDPWAQRRIVADRLDGNPEWEVPRIRDAFLDPRSYGFYFDAVSQVRMTSWSKGRTVLIGDAAHCSSLLAGMGTTIAMTAAEHLAEAVQQSPDNLMTAFNEFEARQRPIAERAQRTVSTYGEMMVPATSSGLAKRNSRLRELADVAANETLSWTN